MGNLKMSLFIGIQEYGVWKLDAYINYVVIAIIILDIITFVAYALHLIYTEVSWLEISSLVLLGILTVLCVVALVMYLVQYHNRFKRVCE